MAKKRAARRTAKPAIKGRSRVQPAPAGGLPQDPTTTGSAVGAAAVIDIAGVRRIAQLARLTLAEHEIPELARDLTAILRYVSKLSELDTAGVEPTTHAVELPSTFRDDVPHPGLPVELGLLNAPERIGDGFGVPKIIE